MDSEEDDMLTQQPELATNTEVEQLMSHLNNMQLEVEECVNGEEDEKKSAEETVESPSKQRKFTLNVPTLSRRLTQAVNIARA